MSKDYIFHALAWHKMFQLSVENRKSLSKDDARQMANCVYLATLVIPIRVANEATKLDISEADALSKQAKLGALVGSLVTPSRASLIAEMVSMGVMNHISPELKDLHAILECDYNPLKLSSTLAPIFDFVGGDDKLRVYLKPMQDVAMTHLLKQVSSCCSALLCRGISVDGCDEELSITYIV